MPYVVFMVATAAQILEALFDGEGAAIHALEPNTTIILSSTGPPEHTLNLRSLLSTKYSRPDIHLVDAPVSGGTIRAAAGTLSIFAAGADEAIEAARPVLNAMSGGHLHVIHGGLGAGTNVKMVHQVLAGINIVMASEAMGFAAKMGLDTKNTSDELSKSEGSSWMFCNRGPHMLVDDPKIYSALNIIVKDVGIVTAAGRASKFPLFLSSATEQVLASAVSAGYGLEDDAHLTKIYLPSTPSLVLELATSSSSSAVITGDDFKHKMKLVEQVMKSVHLAAAMEAMSLGKSIGLEPQMLFEIIKEAAGSSWMFVDRVPGVISGHWKEGRTVQDAVGELTEAMEEANRLKYPLYLGATALQLFQLAALRGWGDEPDVAILKIWEAAGSDGVWFPKDK